MKLEFRDSHVISENTKKKSKSIKNKKKANTSLQ